jgi:two-component system OmpR family sensor kinase
MSIRLRLALTVALVATVLTAAGGAAFIAMLNAGMMATVHDTLRRSALRVRRELATGQLPVAAANARSAATGDQSVVQVLGPGGRVAYTTDTAGQGSLLNPGQRAAAARGPFFVTRSRPGWPAAHLLLAETVRGIPGQPPLVIVVGASLDELDKAMASVLTTLFIGGPLIIAATAAGGWLLAGRALRPVERMRAQVTAVSVRSLGQRLASPRTHDELDKLAGTFNGLLDQLHGTLSRQREFVASAGHELRTPLAVLTAELEYARRPDRTAGEVRATLDVLDSRVRQLSRLSSDLLLLARGDEDALALQPRTQPLEPLVAQSLLLFRARAQRRGSALVLNADPGVRAAVDSGRFQQIVENLVANAIDHGGGSEFIEVSVSLRNGYAVLNVADRGPGLPAEFLPHALERFTRADPARARGGGGSGLGLSIVAMLARAHGGSAEIRNRPEGGAIAEVRIPSAPSAPDAPNGSNVPNGSNATNGPDRPDAQPRFRAGTTSPDS